MTDNNDVKSTYVIPTILTVGSAGLYADAMNANARANNILSELDRLELTTMAYLQKNNYRRYTKMKKKRIKVFPKVSNGSLIMIGSGAALLIAGIVKSQTLDKRDDIDDDVDFDPEALGDAINALEGPEIEAPVEG